jgi:hypothetical protein
MSSMGSDVHGSVDQRPTELPSWMDPGPRSPRQDVWIKANGLLPDDPLLHVCTEIHDMRGASSGDLRSKPLSLTPRGRQLVEQVLASHQSRLGLLLDGLSSSDQERLHHLLVRWGEHLEKLSRQSEPGKRT